MKRKFIIRHKILEYLFTEVSNEEDPQRPARLISSDEISDKINFSVQKVNLYHELLHEKKEIECYSDGSSHEMKITIKGRQSFLDKKYVVEGKKDFWNSIYDPLKIIIPILTIVLSILALSLNQTLKKDLKETKSELESLKQKIESVQK